MSKPIEIIIIRNLQPELEKILDCFRIHFEKFELLPEQHLIISNEKSL